MEENFDLTELIFEVKITFCYMAIMQLISDKILLACAFLCFPWTSAGPILEPSTYNNGHIQGIPIQDVIYKGLHLGETTTEGKPNEPESDTVPIIVGSVLAVIVVAVLVWYIVMRFRRK